MDTVSQEPNSTHPARPDRSDRPMALWGRRVIGPEEVLQNHTVVLEDGVIRDVAPGTQRNIPADRTIRVEDGWIVPGFLDIHTHGGAGHDTMDATAEALAGIAHHLARHGVTGFYPTTMTASAEDIDRCLSVFSSTREALNGSGARMLGIHLEGPYVSHDYRGTQPVELLRDPDPGEYQPWLDSGLVRLITLAPELPGAAELITRAAGLGIRIAIGHTHATYTQSIEAFDLGATQATHLFNGMPPMHHREPGPVGAVLSDDRVYAQLIPDGLHVHPAVLKLAVSAKGVERTVLVSDANRGAGMPDGTYMLGVVRVHTRNGVARNDQGGLAGSTVSLAQGLRIIMHATGLSLPEAIPMVTRVPAAAMGIAPTKGRLAPGSDADIVVLDDDLTVRMTIVAGRVVYTA